MKALLSMIEQHKAGNPIGIYSVCCSHPFVIEASMRHAIANDEYLLIEATSNQVNQFGGYTSMQPSDFKCLVEDIARTVNFPLDHIILGGDHLGPNCWQDLTANEAMARSDVLIEAYVKAGFRKIHLDCSMSCLDDPVPLGDDEVAKRAARLCAVSERAWQQAGGEAPVYIIGTEVPVPGGAHEDLEELAVTSAKDAKTTIDIHKRAFADENLQEAWKRIIGLVVQPGVEFDHHKIIHFEKDKALTLSQYIESDQQMVFEAHSTDYQRAKSLKQLVQGHFAILKVGPWLTFAMREALWGLANIEAEWVDKENCSNLKATVMDTMQGNPKYWQKYYTNNSRKAFDCQYSFSDRIRYYWPDKEISSAIDKLITNIDTHTPPLTLISQYMPAQYEAILSGGIQINAKEMIFHKISQVLTQYSAACYPAMSE